MNALRMLRLAMLVGASILVVRGWRLARRRKAELAQWHERDIVDDTLEQTFPASDPPFWTNTTSG